MFSKRSSFMKANWAMTMALLAVLILSTVTPAFAAAAKLRIGKVTISSPQAGALYYGTPGLTHYSIVVTAQKGAALGIVNFNVTGLPAGVSLDHFSQPTLTLSGGQSGTTIMYLSSSGLTPVGTTSFTVNAVGSNTVPVLGSLQIDPKVATVTASPVSKQYGTVWSPAGSEFMTSGFVGSDGVTSVTLSSPLGAPASAQVSGSPYTITPSAAVGSGLANYNIQYVNGNLTVTPAPLSVTGVVGEDKVYDGLTTASVNASGASLVGVLGTDVVSLDGTAATGTFASPNVGLQSIQVSGLTISGASAANYSVVQPTTTANIDPATVTVTANNAFRPQGFEDPTFTYTYGQFVNGETSAVVTTPPTCGVSGPHDAPNTYPITCSGAVAQNYLFNYVAGQLTVTSSNANPTDIALSNNTIPERIAAGATVGNLTATDPDSALGETYRYSLSTSGMCAGLGADNGAFSLPSYFSGGPVPLTTAASFHYVTKPSYNICVQVDDGFGGLYGKAFVVNVLPSQMVLYSQGKNDGWILQSAPGSKVGGTMNSIASTLFVGDDKYNRQYRSILSFQTSLVPRNATIYGITIQIKQQSATSANILSMLGGLKVDVIKPVYGKQALELTDFLWPIPANAGVANACGFNPALVNGWYSTTSTCSKALPFLNKLGLTQFRLHFVKFSNLNGAANRLSFYSGNTAVFSAPELVITYSVP